MVVYKSVYSSNPWFKVALIDAITIYARFESEHQISMPLWCVTSIRALYYAPIAIPRLPKRLIQSSHVNIQRQLRARLRRINAINKVFIYTVDPPKPCS